MPSAATGKLIALSLMVMPFAVSAQSVDRASTQLTQSIAYDHLAEPLQAPQISLMDLTPRGDFLVPGAVTPALQRDQVPTAARFGDASTGPVGSVGMVHMAGALNPTLLPNAVASLPGLPAATIGAAVDYHFK